jgi:ATP-dependent Clp protease protease subunit
MPSAALAFGLVVAARDLFEVPTRPTAFLAPAQVGEISLTSPVFSAGTWGPSPAAGRVGTIAAPEAEPALSGQGWLFFGAAAVAGVLLSRAATRTRVVADDLARSAAPNKLTMLAVQGRNKLVRSARAAPRRAPTPMMPIGVPKVVYTDKNTQYSDWVDIYNYLYRDRSLFIGQQIDDELANQLIAMMLYNNSESTFDPQYIYLNTPGGSITSGLALHDCMQMVSSPIYTTNLGLSASMGSLLLAAGKRGNRIALPNSRIMIHQPSAGGIRGQAEDIKTEAEFVLKLKEKIVKMYSQMTGMPRDRIARDMERDFFMSAEQAKEYGLIDKVLYGSAEYHGKTATRGP